MTQKLEISLETYLNLGGKFEKVDWSNAYCDYSDNNRGAKIISYEDKGETGGHGTQLVHFTFDNGRTRRYAILWIKLKVDFELSAKYK
jgi:hypothetical protein